MTGAEGAIWMVWVNAAGTARAAPPACQLTVSVIAPATVPVCREKSKGVVLPVTIGVVLPAAMVKSVLLENWIDGSFAGNVSDGSGSKVSCTSPVISAE